jgi:hypothetical protein
MPHEALHQRLLALRRAGYVSLAPHAARCAAC